MPSSQPDIPLNQMLLRISRYLSLLTGQIELLEHLASDLISQERFQKENIIRPLQSIDYINQSIVDLGVLSRLLGERESNSPIKQSEAQYIANQLALSTTRMMLNIGPFFDRQKAASLIADDTYLF